MQGWFCLLFAIGLVVFCLSLVACYIYGTLILRARKRKERPKTRQEEEDEAGALWYFFSPWD